MRVGLFVLALALSGCGQAGEKPAGEVGAALPTYSILQDKMNSALSKVNVDVRLPQKVDETALLPNGDLGLLNQEGKLFAQAKPTR